MAALTSDAIVRTPDADGATVTQALVDGVLYPPLVSSESIRKSKEFLARDEDIWVVSYPKSGTNWLHEMLSMLRQKCVSYSSTDMIAHMLEFDMHSHAQESEQRVIHTHLLPDRLHDSLLSSAAKVIYLYRNPKDTLVSYYHHTCKIPIYQYSGTFSGYLEHRLSGGAMEYGPLPEHLQRWTQVGTRHPQKLHVLSYESLVMNTTHELSRLAAFLQLTCSEQLLADVVKACELKQLKAARVQIATEQGKCSSMTTSMFRKGVIGDWKNHFTVSQSERFDKMLEEQYKAFQLEDPFIYESR